MIPYKITVIFLATFIFFGCMEDWRDTPTTGDPEEVEVSFSYRIPQTDFVTIETKAEGLSPSSYNSVTRASVLIYEVTGGDEEVDKQLLRFHRKTYDLSENTNAGTGTFKVTIPKSKNGEKYVLDILFNAEMYIELVLYANPETGARDQSFPGYAELGYTRQQLQQELYRQTSAGLTLLSAGSWPMWAGVNIPFVIGNDMPVIPVKPIRTFATAFIGLNFDQNLVAQGMQNFKITSIYICNVPNRLSLIPDYTKLNTAKNAVTAPTLPSGYTATGFNGILVANAGNFGNDPWAKYPSYALWENDPDIAANHCFVIGGTFTDPVTGIAYPNQYYRVNVMDAESPGKKLQILRNHMYVINIEGEITEKGWGSVVTAVSDGIYAGTTATARAITAPTDADFEYIVYNNADYMAVSEKELNFSQQGGRLTLAIKCSFRSSASSGGWNATPTESWVTMSQYEYAPTANTIENTQYVDVTIPANATGSPRSAYIVLKLRGSATNLPPLLINVKVNQL